MKRWVFAGILAVICSWGWNLLSFSASQLERPVMLKHYYEVLAYPDFTFELFYITNRNDDRMVIEWASIPETDIVFFNEFTTARNQFSRHEIKSTTLRVSNEVKDLLTEKDLSFEQIEAHLRNGESLLLPIGNIHILPVEDSALANFGVGGSHNGGFSLLRAEEQLDVERISVPFSDKLLPYLTIHVNNQQAELERFIEQSSYEEFSGGEPLSSELFPFHLQKEGRLRVSYQFDFPPDAEEPHQYYSFYAKISGTTEKGGSFMTTAHMRNDPEFDEKVIQRLIKEES